MIASAASFKLFGLSSLRIPFKPARVVLQDFTGVPLLVDLAAMRAAAARLGKDAKIIEPLVPVDLVVDHSVQVDFAGSSDALVRHGADARAAIAAVLGVPAEEIGVRDLTEL